MFIVGSVKAFIERGKSTHNSVQLDQGDKQEDFQLRLDCKEIREEKV